MITQNWGQLYVLVTVDSLIGVADVAGRRKGGAWSTDVRTCVRACVFVYVHV